jgi:low affinity Fe/Cu permease
MDWLRHHFTQLGTLAANPVAFFIVCAYGVLWFLF